MTRPGRRTVAVLAAAALLVGTLGVVLVAGVVHPPGGPSLVDRPLPGLDGRIAALRGPDGDRCILVIEPATGTSRDLACGIDADRLVAAGDAVVASEWDGGAIRVDLASGAVTPTEADDLDLATGAEAHDVHRATGAAAPTEADDVTDGCDEADVVADDGRLEARGDGGEVVLDVPAPRDYWVSAACTSPGGRAATIVDAEDRLLVVDLTRGALRTVSDDVHTAVWLPPPGP